MSAAVRPCANSLACTSAADRAGTPAACCFTVPSPSLPCTSAGGAICLGLAGAAGPLLGCCPSLWPLFELLPAVASAADGGLRCPSVWPPLGCAAAPSDFLHAACRSRALAPGWLWRPPADDCERLSLVSERRRCDPAVSASLRFVEREALGCSLFTAADELLGRLTRVRVVDRWRASSWRRLACACRRGDFDPDGRRSARI